MRVLMFTWEFPPLIAGGLGMACYGMVKALLKLGVEVDLVLPTKELIYMPLRKVEDVDLLPTVFLDPIKQHEFKSKVFETREEKFEFIGISGIPDSYAQLSLSENGQSKRLREYWDSEIRDIDERKLWQAMSDNLVGEEDIIRKVQIFTERAKRFASELKFDIIHAHDWLTYPAGMIARKISGKPMVAHIHATEFDRAGGPGDERVHKIEHAGMSYADRVIAVSQYTAQMIMSRYQIDSGKICIVHNAFTIPEDAVLHKERIFSGPVILFLGRITLQKGPEYFLEMAKRVLDKHPDARFIMAGTGDMGRQMLRDSAAKRLKNKLLFTGFLNRKEVERIIRASDIYVLPSISEPFGISPLEAMAYGITSIISKQSGVSEVVHNAFKIDYWDVDLWVETISHLIENPEKCAKLGYDGMKEVHLIQWDDAAEKLKKVYEEKCSPVKAKTKKSED